MHKPICHMTHVDNLKSIIDTKGLFSKNQNTLAYKNIANEDVQDKRAKKIVTLGQKGTLHDYVPFYFWGVTPMLYATVAQQKDIIFLVSYTDTIAQSGLSFVYTDRHALLKYAKFYDNLAGLSELDWGTIKSKYWSDPDDPAKKEKKQAEFLVYSKVPWELISGIGVINDDVASQTIKIMGNIEHKPTVKVVNQWYYQ